MKQIGRSWPRWRKVPCDTNLDMHLRKTATMADTAHIDQTTAWRRVTGRWVSRVSIARPPESSSTDLGQFAVGVIGSLRHRWQACSAPLLRRHRRPRHGSPRRGWDPGRSQAEGGKARKVAEYPAMLARVQGHDGHAVSLHRTDLLDSPKLPATDAKKILAAGINGAAVRLCEAGDELAVAECIETALDDAALAVFKDDTLCADDKAFFLKVRDVAEAALSEACFRQAASKLRRTMGISVTGDPAMTVDLLAQCHALNDSERAGVMHHLITGGDLSGCGLVNAVTDCSQEVSDYDRATEFEALGGQADRAAGPGLDRTRRSQVTSQMQGIPPLLCFDLKTGATAPVLTVPANQPVQPLPPSNRRRVSR